MVPNRLYLNQGGLKFKDVTETTGVGISEKWKSGIALADVNQDGLLDIYVCATLSKDSALRANALLINMGINEEGIPFFQDQAGKYGVADKGYSSNAAFLDYDKDGDLDLYVLTNVLSGEIPTAYRNKILDGTAINNDRLYKNNGNGTFTNITKEAGIVIEGYGLGLAIADLNHDNWPDIYVGNDYMTNDILYINNRDGTFSNQIEKFVKHQSQFSMGNDVADINNDGYPDIITLDMLPETNLRRKTVIGGIGYVNYINNKKYGYQPQHVRNMLELNNGNNSFSEIGQLSGVYQTEWSWSPLFADFDNDGDKDLLITNGFPKDITDKDFGNYRNGQAGTVASAEMLIDSIPVVKVSNYAYRNNGDLTFSDVTKEWGMSIPSFSNGAAFADLDNDGDLDYIVNNINDVAFVYENLLYHEEKTKESLPNFLRIKLVGQAGNSGGLGAKVTLYSQEDKLQYHDHSVYRGYLSTVEDVIHFGLGKVTVVDSVSVLWPDGKLSQFKNIKPNQVLMIDHKNASPEMPKRPGKSQQTHVEEVSSILNVKFLHQEDDKIDFNIQRTMPHKYSQYGPGIAVGDINGDGLEDFYVSGSSDYAGSFFVQSIDGKFNQSNELKIREKTQEELGVLFFDADSDGDLDLYAVSGSFEWEPGHMNYHDRLYVNNGVGIFKESPEALPKETSSGSCVRATDYDADGDLDLFVGGRVLPGKYPFAAESFVFKNEGGKFTDATDESFQGLKNLGMITDALWTDFDNDGRVDLVVVGELLPITFFKNSTEGFKNIGTYSGINNFLGWWNSITAADFDHDGDMDYVAGNLGLNNYYHASTERPVKVFAKDFDGNGSIDPITACYFKIQDGSEKLCPVHFWDELNSQSPKFRRQFSRYRQYGKATMEDLLTPEDLEGAIILEGNYAASSYIENLGSGKFKMVPLPIHSQFAPVFGMVADDVDGDGNMDVVQIGNDYGNEVFTGRYDAFIGLLLRGNGKGSFDITSPDRSGFFVNGDAKALAKLSMSGGDIFIATQNRDSLKVFVNKLNDGSKEFSPEPSDSWAEFTHTTGKRQKIEFYYGSGYLSQSTRRLRIPKGVKTIAVYNSKGEVRNIAIEK